MYILPLVIHLNADPVQTSHRC